MLQNINAYVMGLPPSSSGGCQEILALSFLTSLTSSGPLGLPGAPVGERNIVLNQYL